MAPSPCPSDVKLDGVVNQLDVDQWGIFRALARYSSLADINQDRKTNNHDLDAIKAEFLTLSNIARRPENRAAV